MSIVTIEVDDARVLAVLARLSAGLVDRKPLLLAWGEELVASTKQRFVAGVSPDGARWAPNTESTYLAYLRHLSGSYDKQGRRTGVKRGYETHDGRIAARGVTAAQGKRPLIGLSRSLSTQIYYRIDGQALLVGSPMVSSAMQQFGGTKAKFPHLWGDIPARPFLGLSDADVRALERSALDYLADLFR